MAKTSSIKFPNMIDPARNIVNVAEDSESVVNRCKLLILTEPTELYNEPKFGVGLKRYLWQYNTVNTEAMIHDRVKDQLNMWEPCVYSESTEFAPGLLFTEGGVVDNTQNFNQLKMTVGLKTTFGEEATLSFDDLEEKYNKQNAWQQ